MAEYRTIEEYRGAREKKRIERLRQAVVIAYPEPRHHVQRYSTRSYTKYDEWQKVVKADLS